jgi:hypothetical protein
MLQVVDGEVAQDITGNFTSVKLTYTLNPQIEYTQGGNFGPSQRKPDERARTA